MIVIFNPLPHTKYAIHDLMRRKGIGQKHMTNQNIRIVDVEGWKVHIEFVPHGPIRVNSEPGFFDEPHICMTKRSEDIELRVSTSNEEIVLMNGKEVTQS